ncbi:heat shock protein Hsp20 [Alkalidesulfovibrio alkalitolerans DSM 16529]|jgi:HSP20 family protein|uniref:Heat shock protein Hsp20 n=1 Tax=Alkalidesulfovibrio alkalitolerans DSM 16529 TaxID=1121439 RepID=S7T759_9BACT|nr:Hsp20/alpha crystallin family protein [Alkalidesulfovibrio alkalitolerans]EPR32300.1 heat shock protein Hsp20 [Alkalidesulfovibrio alkalitolerans DSM 16529]
MAKLNVNPWLLIEDMRGRMDDLMDHLADPRGARERPGNRHEGAFVWQPRADVYETADQVTIEIELPGLAAEDMAVEVEKGHVRVYGERRFVKDSKGPAFHTLERAHGPFERVLPLPTEVEANGARAVLRDGLLTIVLAKREKPASSRRIHVAMRD